MEPQKIEELCEVLDELEDAAAVSRASIERLAGGPLSEDRMRLLCDALHSMPVLIARSLLLASELPGYAAPIPRRYHPPLYDALAGAERMNDEAYATLSTDCQHLAVGVLLNTGEAIRSCSVPVGTPEPRCEGCPRPYHYVTDPSPEPPEQ
jgi:hypothetical protein